MKLDAYHTLTSMAQAVATKETATESPYILVIKDPEDGGIALCGSCSSHNMSELVATVLKNYVATMKKSVKEGVDVEKAITEQLATLCGMAMAANFIEEKTSALSELIDELPDEIREELAEMFRKGEDHLA